MKNCYDIGYVNHYTVRPPKVIVPGQPQQMKFFACVTLSAGRLPSFVVLSGTRYDMGDFNMMGPASTQQGRIKVGIAFARPASFDGCSPHQIAQLASGLLLPYPLVILPPLAKAWDGRGHFTEWFADAYGISPDTIGKLPVDEEEDREEQT